MSPIGRRGHDLERDLEIDRRRSIADMQHSAWTLARLIYARMKAGLNTAPGLEHKAYLRHIDVPDHSRGRAGGGRMPKDAPLLAV
jgi:hypothetical protein